MLPDFLSKYLSEVEATVRKVEGVVLTISGKLGDDAKHYQEKEVVKKIKESQK
jgi:hypothetical protein